MVQQVEDPHVGTELVLVVADLLLNQKDDVLLNVDLLVEVLGTQVVRHLVDVCSLKMAGRLMLA